MHVLFHVLPPKKSWLSAVRGSGMLVWAVAPSSLSTVMLRWSRLEFSSTECHWPSFRPEPLCTRTQTEMRNNEHFHFNMTDDLFWFMFLAVWVWLQIRTVTPFQVPWTLGLCRVAWDEFFGIIHNNEELSLEKYEISRFEWARHNILISQKLKVHLLALTGASNHISRVSTAEGVWQELHRKPLL